MTKNVSSCVCHYFHGPSLVAICTYLAIGLLCFEGRFFPLDDRICRGFTFLISNPIYLGSTVWYFYAWMTKLWLLAHKLLLLFILSLCWKHLKFSSNCFVKPQYTVNNIESPYSLQLLFRKFNCFITFHLLCEGAHIHVVHMWGSKDNFVELILPILHVYCRKRTRPSGLAASTFTSWVFSLLRSNLSAT